MVDPVSGVVNVLIGGLLRPVVDGVYKTVSEGMSRRLLATRQKLDLAFPDLAVEFFGDSLANLYETATFNLNRRLPMVWNRTLSLSGSVSAASDEFVRVDDYSKQQFTVDDKVVKGRQALGKVWDGELLFIERLEEAGGRHPIVVAGLCNYYSYVTFAAHVEAGLRGKSSYGSRLIDESLKSMEMVLQAPVKPIILAAATVCVFETQHGPQVLCHIRSTEVIHARGMLGVTPIFGMEGNYRDGIRSRHGVLFYNFIKEFLEECYGMEKLIHESENFELGPDWFLDLPLARAMLAEFKSGRASFELLGTGLDATDGSLNFALLAHFKSKAFCERFDRQKAVNFEAEGSFRWYKLFGPKIENEVAEGNVVPSSLFALDLARTRLRR